MINVHNIDVGWGIFNGDRWDMDESIYIRCKDEKNDVAFKYKGDGCLTVGITNGNRFVNGFDYILDTSQDGVVYTSYMNKMKLFNDGGEWVIESMDTKNYRKIPFIMKSNAKYPYQMTSDDVWMSGDNELTNMAVNCENPGKEYYYKKWRDYWLKNNDHNQENCDSINTGSKTLDYFIQYSFGNKWKHHNLMHNGIEYYCFADITKYPVTTLCDNNGAPLLDSNGNEVFCGRGRNRQDCPDKYECNIAPNDGYAICCPNKELSEMDKNNRIPELCLPMIGIGTAALNNDGDVIKWAVVDFGYKLIDSASDHAPWYQNEYIIGNYNQDNTLPKHMLNNQYYMVTTKLYAKDIGNETVYNAIEDSLATLKVDYIDIYLIHFPNCDGKHCKGTWKTAWDIMSEYFLKNKIKYIGVSNFDIHEYHELLDYTSGIPIFVIQNWFDPLYKNDNNLIIELNDMNTLYQGYSLFGGQHLYRGYKTNPVTTNTDIINISNKYNKSVYKIISKWALQRNIGIIPRSKNKKKIQSNLDLYDFTLNDNDINIINSL